MKTFSNTNELADLNGEDSVLQLGEAGGIWVRVPGKAENNGGTVACLNESYHWKRQCNPALLDARWFGVHGDGRHDDSAALQAAINALPPAGGKVVLPSGTMRCLSSLTIGRSFVSIEGVNCGLLSKHFEPGGRIGRGSLLLFEGCDGLVIQPPAKAGAERPPRLGGITFRDFGIAGTGRQSGQTGIVVKSGEGWRWGSTDGLLIDRLYTIDLSWAGDFAFCDMSVITSSWFSECGNGLRFDRCVYNCVTNCCFADNDGWGLLVSKGKGCELTSNIFVRNKVALEGQATSRLRVVGGTFETDGAGGQRCDEALVKLRECEDTVLSSANFSISKSDISAPVLFTGEKPTTSGCRYCGDLMKESQYE